MRHFKFVVIAFLSIMICFGFLITSHDDAGGIPEDIQHYAEGKGLEAFKKMIRDDPVGYGYEDAEEVNNVKLGPGFKVHLFDHDKFDRMTDRLMDVSKPTGQRKRSSS